MILAELEEWAFLELPPYSKKNIHPEYLKSNIEYIFDANSGSGINPMSVLKRCRCTMCKRMVIEDRMHVS